MHLDPHNFLTHIKNLITGGGRDASGNAKHDSGFLREVPVALSALDLNTTLAVNTSDAGAAADPVLRTGAYLASDETNARVVHVDENTDLIGRLTFAVPSDYDEATDELKIRVLASQVTSSTDNDVELDSELYVKTAGAALSADKNPDAPGVVLGTTEKWVEFDLSGFGLRRDDVLTFRLNTNGANDTNGEEVLIHAVKIAYRSCLVSYDEEDASGRPLR